jgi:hypothetical protein
MINRGDEGVNTTQAILDRLPNRVEFLVNKVKTESSLEDWHNPAKGPGLKDICMNKIFPGMAWNPKQKLVPGAAAGLGTITAEVPHPGEAF